MGELSPPSKRLVVEGTGPPGGPLGVVDPGEPVAQFLELPAGLEAGAAGQVGPGVALHVHQAALDARARPDGGAGPLHAAQPVRDEHVGSGDAAEQGRVGRRVLMVAPLPVDDLAAGPVDGDDQAPAVGHAGAVRHDRVVDHTVRLDGRGDVPAPADPFAKGPGSRGAHLLLCPARQQPVQELAQLEVTGPVPSDGGRAQGAGRALPALGTGSGAPALLHRPMAHRAMPGPLRSGPHAPIEQDRKARPRDPQGPH